MTSADPWHDELAAHREPCLIKREGRKKNPLHTEDSRGPDPRKQALLPVRLRVLYVVNREVHCLRRRDRPEGPEGGYGGETDNLGMAVDLWKTVYRLRQFVQRNEHKS
jgi:hypothetical protein